MSMPIAPPRVLHRDAHFLALAKPSGIATTAPDDGPSLFAQAHELDPKAPQLHPLSRLDTQVTGLVVFARTPLANQLVLEARRAGRLFRRYLGLAADVPTLHEGDWQAAIGIDPRDPKKRRALADDAEGPGIKSAHTRYLTRARTGSIVALELFPQTGRTHQLRVHAAHAGHPLLGDTAYGGLKRLTLSNGRILTAARVMLHCEAVALPHPDPRVATLSLTLAPEPDMERLWSSAGGALEQLTTPRSA